ncbi:ATP-binding protein [Inhella gelatinilytica]|uniref:Virulence sensor protein BvgS n=1 Tax=Inhella gelatinilytica TaxID=2795030 RepID=A0A931IVW7_9BURK|nr:ATP-binding protein [Inhella gelatinilytica]MBH9552536.1 response regulator [Inhella gelatinilytica]
MTWPAGRFDWTDETAALFEFPTADAPPTLPEWLGLFSPDAQLSLHAALDQAQRRGQGFDMLVNALTHKDRRLRLRVVGEVLSSGGRPVGVRGSVQDTGRDPVAAPAGPLGSGLAREALDALSVVLAHYDPQGRLRFCNEAFRAQWPALAEYLEPGCSLRALLTEVAERGWVPLAAGRELMWVEAQQALWGASAESTDWHLGDGRVWRWSQRRLSDGSFIRMGLDLTEWLQASAHAQQAAQARTRFMAQMSHEIRNPLHAIQGWLTLLARSGLAARQQAHVSHAQAATHGLMELVNDTLDLTRMESGSLGLERRPFALRPLLQELGALIQAAIGSKPVACAVVVDPEVPEALVGDALRLRQIVLNLGSNAAKFTSTGRIDLRVAVRARSASGCRLAFEVEDTGRGIPAEDQARIFLGFQQGDRATAREFGGSGLGLAISHHLVGQMGGQLLVQSQVGVGSRFFFELDFPVAASLASPVSRVSTVSAGPPSGPGPLRGLRLLVADDHGANRQVMTELLEQEGAWVQAVRDGSEVLAAFDGATASDRPWDALILDIQMPGLDGLQVTQALRGLGVALPIVGLTAQSSESQREAALAAGMDLCLTKPVAWQSLRDRLAHVCGRGLTADSPPAERTQRAASGTDGDGLTEATRRAGVNWTAGLARLGGQSALYRRYLTAFIQDFEAAAPNDGPEWRRRVHALQGNAATLGAETVAQALGAAVAASGALPVPEAWSQIQAAFAPYRPGLIALAHTLQGMPPGRSTVEAVENDPQDDGLWGDGLRGLLSLLEQSDAAAVEALEHLKPVARGRKLDDLETLVHDFDFAAAAQWVRDRLAGGCTD